MGIDYIDALDSKRRDLAVTHALLCSNSGFTAPALHKAKRVGIGAVSVVARGDRRVKVVIRETLYTRDVHITGMIVTCEPVLEGPEVGDLRHNGKLVYKWLQHKAAMAIGSEPFPPNPLHLEHVACPGTVFRTTNRSVVVTRLSSVVDYETEWRAHDVKVDADRGLYDWLTGSMKLTPGGNRYELQGYDLEGGRLVEPPDDVGQLKVGLVPGAVEVAICQVHGVGFRDNEEVPQLDPLIARTAVGGAD